MLDAEVAVDAAQLPIREELPRRAATLGANDQHADPGAGLETCVLNRLDEDLNCMDEVLPACEATVTLGILGALAAINQQQQMR